MNLHKFYLIKYWCWIQYMISSDLPQRKKNVKFTWSVDFKNRAHCNLNTAVQVMWYYLLFTSNNLQSKCYTEVIHSHENFSSASYLTFWHQHKVTVWNITRFLPPWFLFLVIVWIVNILTFFCILSNKGMFLGDKLGKVYSCLLWCERVMSRRQDFSLISYRYNLVT